SKDGFKVDASAASFVSNLQSWLGSDCGKDSERAGDSLCMSFLPAFAPRFGPRSGIPENAARAVGGIAPGWGVRENDGALPQKRTVHRRPSSREGGSVERAERKESCEDVVAPLDDSARDGGAHDRSPQRQEVHSRVHHRADGGSQAW